MIPVSFGFAARHLLGLPAATMLVLGTGSSAAQDSQKREPVLSAPGGGPVPTPPDPNEVRASGLWIGRAGFSTGPGGGLDKELIRNNPPLTPPPAPGLGAPSNDAHDLSGSWYGDQFLPAFEIVTDMYGAKVPFNEVGRKVMDRRLVAMDQGKPLMSPSILCRPSGPDALLVRITTRFYQSKDRIDIFSTAGHDLWSIALNPALLPPAGQKSYMGRSIGHWEGDTLVVVNSDFKTRRWLSFRGTPISPAGTLTYQISKIRDGDQWVLQVITTVDDATFYTRRWKFARSFSWRPDLALVDEFDCETQVGSSSGAQDTGAVPEPED